MDPLARGGGLDSRLVSSACCGESVQVWLQWAQLRR